MLPHALQPQHTSAELRGLVRAAETEEPLPGAQVLLPDLGFGAQTNEEGRFWLRDLPVGRHGLEVRFLGRSSGRVQVTLAPGRVTSLELSLEVEPVQVPELRVEVERRWGGKMAGFYERMERSGGGRFITREEIEATPGSQLHHVFRPVPGVRVVRCDGVACYRLVSGRPMPSFNPAGPCLAGVFREWRSNSSQRTAARHQRDLGARRRGIEVYTGIAAQPVQYSGSKTRSGLVLIWTR